jgi:hypothetical protein
VPLQFVPIPITLGGLDQKASSLTRAPGKLEHAINVEFDKTGRLNKRRGYQLVDTSAAVNRWDDDAIMLHVTTHRNELLVVTYDYVMGMASKDEAMTQDGAVTAAFVYRGPNNRGSCRLHYVSTSRTSQGSSG